MMMMMMHKTHIRIQSDSTPTIYYLNEIGGMVSGSVMLSPERSGNGVLTETCG